MEAIATCGAPGAQAVVTALHAGPGRGHRSRSARRGAVGGAGAGGSPRSLLGRLPCSVEDVLDELPGSKPVVDREGAKEEGEEGLRETVGPSTVPPSPPPPRHHLPLVLGGRRVCAGTRGAECFIDTEAARPEKPPHRGGCRRQKMLREHGRLRALEAFCHSVLCAFPDRENGFD